MTIFIRFSILLSILWLGAGTTSCYSQDDDESKIDPSRYLIIYERLDEPVPLWYTREDSIKIGPGAPKLKRINPKKRTLFQAGPKYLRANYFPYQPHEVISTSSIIEMYFDTDSLAKNINLYGSISLEAVSGKRNIEIEPYYQTGISQSTYGVDSKPIKEIANYFMRLTVVTHSLISQYNDFAKSYERLVDDKRVSQIRLLINKAIVALPTGTNSNLNDEDYNRAQEIANLLSDGHPNKLDLQTFASLKVQELRTTLVKALSNTNFTTINPAGLYQRSYYTRNVFIDTTAESARQKDITQLSRTYEDFFRDVTVMNNQLNAIATSDDNTIKAFLNFTFLTITDFRAIIKDLNSLANQVKPYPTFDLFNRSGKGNELLYTLRCINHNVKTFSDNGGNIKNLLELARTEIETIKNAETKEAFQLLLNDDVSANLVLHDGYLLLKEEKNVYEFLRNKLAVEAGRLIFSNLIRGTINVKNAKILDGEYLEIMLVWNKAPNDSVKHLKNGDLRVEKMPVGKFLVKKTGWHLEISESALLVHRIDAEQLGADYPISPSNFKPTAGASMLWSYFNTHRVKDEAKAKWLIRTIHWLEPSFGINVSYLDFRTDRDVEFGAGPVIGFWQNRVFINTGYNFSVNGESPFYMSIGFSFLNIFQRIKDNDGK